MKETIKVLVTIKAEYDSFEIRKELCKEIKESFKGIDCYMGGGFFETKSNSIIKIGKKKIDTCDKE